MFIKESYSAKKFNPRTLVEIGCMVWEFNTGHKLTRWADGTEFYNSKTGAALNQKTGHKLIAEMQSLVPALGK